MMMEREIDPALVRRATSGEPLAEAELRALDTVDVLQLGMLADEVRRARVGVGVTFTRVIEPDEDIALERLAELAGGGVEVRLHAPDGSIGQTADRVARVRAALGAGRRLTGFSLADLRALAPGAVPSSLDALRAAGLDAVAHAPIDDVDEADLDAVAAAGLQLDALSVQREASDRVGVILAARRVLDGRGWIGAFAPLPREQSVAAPTTGYHDVRMVALSRLGLPGVRVIQVDWRQSGPKLAQVALTFGANHLDGVSPYDDAALGPRRGSVEEVRRNIAAAGFVPEERGARA